MAPLPPQLGSCNADLTTLFGSRDLNLLASLFSHSRSFSDEFRYTCGTLSSLSHSFFSFSLSTLNVAFGAYISIVSTVKTLHTLPKKAFTKARLTQEKDVQTKCVIPVRSTGRYFHTNVLLLLLRLLRDYAERPRG